MKKRRSTVYVRPGKDVTLYVPAETPPEVIDYLNELKKEGIFSQGVMEIVTKYVQQHRSASAAAHLDEVDEEAAMSEAVSSFGPFRDREPAQSPDPAAAARNDEPPEQPEQAPPETVVHKRFSLAQIFRQAQHNSGKLIDSRENS